MSHARMVGLDRSSSGSQMSLMGEEPLKHRMKTWRSFLLPLVSPNACLETQILPLLSSAGAMSSLPPQPPLPYPEGIRPIYQKEAGPRKVRAQDERSRRRRMPPPPISSCWHPLQSGRKSPQLLPHFRHTSLLVVQLHQREVEDLWIQLIIF